MFIFIIWWVIPGWQIAKYKLVLIGFWACHVTRTAKFMKQAYAKYSTIHHGTK